MARPAVRELILAACLFTGSACSAGPQVELGGERFQVELATEPGEQARGLMFRDELPEGHGMLFVYGREAWRSFWMKNMRIPLDILFFDGQRRLINWHTADPCTADPCPGYPSDAPARYVLELNAGRATELGLEPGDRLRLEIESR